MELIADNWHKQLENYAEITGTNEDVAELDTKLNMHVEELQKQLTDTVNRILKLRKETPNIIQTEMQKQLLNARPDITKIATPTPPPSEQSRVELKSLLENTAINLDTLVKGADNLQVSAPPLIGKAKRIREFLETANTLSQTEKVINEPEEKLPESPRAVVRKKLVNSFKNTT